MASGYASIAPGQGVVLVSKRIAVVEETPLSRCNEVAHVLAVAGFEIQVQYIARSSELIEWRRRSDVLFVFDWPRSGQAGGTLSEGDL